MAWVLDSVGATTKVHKDHWDTWVQLREDVTGELEVTFLHTKNNPDAARITNLVNRLLNVKNDVPAERPTVQDKFDRAAIKLLDRGIKRNVIIAALNAMVDSLLNP